MQENISKDILEMRKQLVLQLLESFGESSMNDGGIMTTKSEDGKVSQSSYISGCGEECGYFSVFLSDKMGFNSWWFDDFQVGMDALREYLEFKRKYKLM